MDSYADRQESEVILQAQQGDERAMEFLLRKYQGLLNYICDKYFLKDGERDDLMQEAMIGFVQAVKYYDPQNGKLFKNFAYLCVKRELDSCVKRSNRKKHMVLNEAISMSNFAEGNEDSSMDKMAYLIEKDSSGNIISPETVVVDKESYNEVMNQINGMLSRMEMNVLLMRLMGHSYNEITDALQLENKSVDNAVQRIRKKVNNSKAELSIG